MAKTTEELMKPRYKVIADWPGVAGKVTSGDIIVRDGAHNGFWVAGEQFTEDKLKDYPHLFRKLQWWEDRKKEDMPEYVKENEYKIYYSSWVIKGDFLKMILSENPNELQCAEYFVLKNVMCFFEPATESDYSTYLQSQQKNKV
jgi:hypothetical protein